MAYNPGMEVERIAGYVGRNVKLTLRDGSEAKGALRGSRIEGLYHVVTWQPRLGTIIEETGPQIDIWANDITSISEI